MLSCRIVNLQSSFNCCFETFRSRTVEKDLVALSPGPLDLGADPAGEASAWRRAEPFAQIAAPWEERDAVPNKRARTLLDDRNMLAHHMRR